MAATPRWTHDAWCHQHSEGRMRGLAGARQSAHRSPDLSRLTCSAVPSPSLPSPVRFSPPPHGLRLECCSHCWTATRGGSDGEEQFPCLHEYSDIDTFIINSRVIASEERRREGKGAFVLEPPEQAARRICLTAFLAQSPGLRHLSVQHCCWFVSSGGQRTLCGLFTPHVARRRGSAAAAGPR